MGNIKLEGYVCERCGHKWVPRETTIEEPKVLLTTPLVINVLNCSREVARPKCKSPYWNTPRKNEERK